MRLARLPFLGALLCAATLSAQIENVVVIISDDAGFADWGLMDAFTGGTTEIPTPNLDALRASGTLLTDAYTAAVCSPSRCAIVTGSYQQRIGYEYNINNITSATGNPDGLSPGTNTIFDQFKFLGHTTGAIGKWHLGAKADVDATTFGNRPNRMGVDEFFGIWKGSRNYTVGGVNDSGTLREAVLNPDNSVGDIVRETQAPWNGMNVTNAFGKGAVDFIDRHYAETEPFFLYVAFTAPHGPLHQSPDYNDPAVSSITPTNRREYASMMFTMDKEIGRIIAKLDDPNGDLDNSDSLLSTTLIVFINDNGGASSNASVNTPLRNFKGSTFEGGIRVPMIVSGPGVPGGATFSKPVHSIDILPTCVSAVGGVPPAGIDGVDLLPFLDGTDSGDPHETVIVRSEADSGVRKGNWKLQSNGRGDPFELYDLASDIGESTDLSGANPAVVTELQQDLTAFEAGFDKPRHASLNGSINDINLNDRFNLTAVDAGGVTFTSNLALVGPGLLNGDFNDDTSPDDQRTFADTPEWFNLAGNQTTQATRSNNTDPQDPSRNAVAIDNGARQFALDTGHTLATGEIFQVTYRWRDASGWGDGTDRMSATLFTTDDDMITGTRTDWFSENSALSTANSTYESQVHLSGAAPASVNGKRLFLLIDAQNGTNGTGDFARFDSVTLDRGMVMVDTTPTTLNWSDANIWTDADTSNPDTLLDLDAFASAELAFAVSEDFDYIATNDMTRATGLEFMLNRIILDGTFSGTGPQSGTIDGNALLFTNDLQGNLGGFNLAADGADYTFTVANDLLLFDDLAITGGGDATFRLTGSISDYGTASRGITKSGISEVILAGGLNYTGPTIVDDGALLVEAGTTLTASSSVTTNRGGIVGGDGTITPDIGGDGGVAPGQSIGTLTAGGSVSAGLFIIEVDGASNDLLDVTGELDLTNTRLALVDLGGGFTEPSYLIASYGTLVGTFTSTVDLPENYIIDYAFDDGMSSNNIALIMTAPTTPVLILVDYDDGVADRRHDAAVLNGDFEDNDGPAGATLDFTQVADWFNYDVSQPTIQAARDNLPSAVGGPWNGILSEAGDRLFSLASGYTLASGDEFTFSFAWRDALAFNDGLDLVRATLFTTDDNTPTGAIEDSVELFSTQSLVDSTYQREQFNGIALPGTATGKQLYLTIEGLDGNGAASGFARFDNVYLALTSGTLSAYQTFATVTSGLSGPAAAFDADPNGDGVANGLAFLLGAADANLDARALLPTIAYNQGTDAFTLTYRRANATNDGVEHSTDLGNLDAWDAAVDGTDGVSVNVITDGFGPGVDRVEVSLPAALAFEGKLFARLTATE